jgi:thermitase
MIKKILFFATALLAISLIGVFGFLLKSNQNSYSRNIVQNTDKSEQAYNPPKPDKNAPKSEPASTVVTISSQADLNALAQANNIKPESIKKIEGSSSYEVAVSKSELIVPTGIEERVKTQENIIYKAMATPNDPLFQYQWHLNKISAPPAWDISKSSSSIKVAVIDSGFALDHQDLTNKFDKANAYDFINNDSIPMAGDTGAFVYHGTMVAGLVGASTNNGIGVSSVGWDVSILPIQALNDSGEGNTFTIASAINYSVSKGAKVINLSLGSFSADPVMEAAINNAISNGVSVVAASGNSGCDCIIYPANYTNVIAVGATDINDNRASFSNYGNNLDIVAPGTGSIRTTFMSGSNKTSLYTTSANGTSIATPIVSGAIALVLDKKPDLRPTQVDAFLKNGADKVIGMNDQNFTKEYGYGRLNIEKVLTFYQSAYAGQSSFPTIQAGQSATGFFMYRNTGNMNWYDDVSLPSAPAGTNPVRLSTTNPTNRASIFGNNWGVNKNRPSNNLAAVYESDGTTLAANQHIVQPGQIGKYSFTFDAPSGMAPGTYQEFFKLVAEGLPDTAINNPGTYLSVRVQ